VTGPRAPRALRRVILATVTALAASVAACGQPAPKDGAPSAVPQQAGSKRYTVVGQVLVVSPERQSLSIKHEDIVGYMPAMTMTFPVATPDLMKDRVPGELVKATLEVDDSAGRLVAIEHTGNAPLPDSANLVALAAEVLEPGQEAPDAALIDQNDKRRSFSEWRGEPTVLTFVYTRCPLPNFCPLMDKNFQTIQREGAKDPALAGKFKLVTVSFDPDYDTPAVLKAHAAKRGADPAVWTFLTGDRVTVERFAAKFGVGVVREGTEAGDLTHNLRTVLIGADGKILHIYGGSDWSTATLLDDLRAAVTHAPGK
jgi:protein SCO1/2